jgi:hypothetical protein
MRVALINTNRMRPPIAPIGLDYIAEALGAAGHQADLLDLCWESDPPAAIAAFFGRAEYGLAGVTLRNTDDCGFTSRESFVPGFIEMVAAIRRHAACPIVLGGVGFSVMPEQILGLTAADAGVWGEGEFVLPALASRIESNQEWRDLPGLVWRSNGAWRRNSPAPESLAALPPMRRRWVDNARYFREGGQAGFETKRGCPGRCVYCVDPVAKGAATRLRPPAAVADEIESLLEQGIDHLHTCDGEFNLPPAHALEVCAEIVRRGLAGRLRWYAYCSPAPFSWELAQAMRQAGCAGINFGADHGDPAMLARLGRAFSPQDILNATRWSKEAGMAVMLDLLLGSPGETEESLARTVDLVKRADPDRAGVSVGVRLYPGTELSRRLATPEQDPRQPVFFLEPRIEHSVFGLLDRLIGDDPRFLFFDPSKPAQNYNYNANHRLVAAIAAGHRGAYWDILRRCG